VGRALAAGTLGLLPGLLAPVVCAAQESLPTVEVRATTATSHDGHIWITSTRGADKLFLMKWAGGVIDRVERMVGAEWRRPGRQLRVIVRAGDAAGTVAASQGIRDRRLVQRLAIENFPALDRGVADEALCKLLVAAYVVQQRGQRTPGVAEWVRDDVLESLPAWLWQGLSRNLLPSRRADNRRIVLDAWTGGQLPLPAAFLAGSPEAKGDPELTQAYSGMLVSWFLSLPDSDGRFARFFKRLSEGDALTPEWLIGSVPGCDSAAAFDGRWDEWMLTQKRRIHEPGRLGEEDLQALRAALVLHPGLAGLPMSAEWGKQGSFRDLVRHRKDPWIPSFASARTLHLRTLALGKDERLQAVVGAYCDFLEALRRRKRAGKLNKLLDRAETALDELSVGSGAQSEPTTAE